MPMFPPNLGRIFQGVPELQQKIEEAVEGGNRDGKIDFSEAKEIIAQAQADGQISLGEKMVLWNTFERSTIANPMVPQTYGNPEGPGMAAPQIETGAARKLIDFMAGQGIEMKKDGLASVESLQTDLAAPGADGVSKLDKLKELDCVLATDVRLLDKENEYSDPAVFISVKPGTTSDELRPIYDLINERDMMIMIHSDKEAGELEGFINDLYSNPNLGADGMVSLSDAKAIAAKIMDDGKVSEGEVTVLKDLTENANVVSADTPQTYGFPEHSAGTPAKMTTSAARTLIGLLQEQGYEVTRPNIAIDQDDINRMLDAPNGDQGTLRETLEKMGCDHMNVGWSYPNQDNLGDPILTLRFGIKPGNPEGIDTDKLWGQIADVIGRTEYGRPTVRFDLHFFPDNG